GGDSANFPQQLEEHFHALAKKHGWKIRTDSAEWDSNKVKKRILLSVEGKNAYDILKHEIGQHEIEFRKGPKTLTNTLNVSLLPVSDAKKEIALAENVLEI